MVLRLLILVGQVPQMGLGYFIGLQLDEPTGANNGTISAISISNVLKNSEYL